MEEPQPNSKYDHVYAIVRVDAFDDANTPVEALCTVTKIVWTEEAAVTEVARLNQLNNDKGSRYFFQLSRLERKHEEV